MGSLFAFFFGAAVDVDVDVGPGILTASVLMDSADIAEYAKMVRRVLTMAGPQPRLRIGLPFQKLGLSKSSPTASPTASSTRKATCSANRSRRWRSLPGPAGPADEHPRAR